MSVACLYVYVTSVCLVPKVARRGNQNPGTGVTDDCELPYRYWELNLGLPEVQHFLLTTES